MTGRTIEIAGRRIGSDAPPFVIAELSANHGGSFDRALRIIDMAAESGADAVKFQAYTADSLTIDSDAPDFLITGDNPWRGRRLHELYRSAATPYEWFPEMFAHARRQGVTPFASPFDAAAVAMLEKLDCPAYKIASFEAVDLDLIDAAAATGKPLIVSTGMCDAGDVQRALATAREAGAGGVALLKCTSAYPSDPADANLATIPEMARRFGVPVGISDHTLGVAVSVAGCALGAALVEKHVIDARHPETADSEFSLLPQELTDLVRDCRSAWAAVGAVRYGPSPGEEGSRSFRRSLYAVADVAECEPFNRDNVRAIRPGFGLPPYRYPEVVRRLAARPIKRGEPIVEDALGPEGGAG